MHIISSKMLNKRAIAGIIFLVVLAPASKYMYLLFPQEGFGEFLIRSKLVTIPNFIEGNDWFYLHIYWWLYAVGDTLAPILTLLGIFFLFPRKYSLSYLIGIPLGFMMALFFNHATASSNYDLHNLTFISVAIGILCSVAGLVVLDKFLFKNVSDLKASEGY